MAGAAQKSLGDWLIGAAFEVYNVLGYGFLEQVYKKAMQAELISRGFGAAVEHEIFVYYKKVQGSASR